MFSLNVKRDTDTNFEPIFDHDESLMEVMKKAEESCFNVFIIFDTEGDAVLRGLRFSRDSKIHWRIETQDNKNCLCPF